MKTIAIIFLFLSMSVYGMAQVTTSETIKLALDYLNGMDERPTKFCGAIFDETDKITRYSILPDALYDGCSGEIGAPSNGSHPLVILRKEFATLYEAQKNMAEVIAALKAYYPAIAPQTPTPSTKPNLVEEQFFFYTYASFKFGADLKIFQQTGADKQYKLIISLINPK